MFRSCSLVCTVLAGLVAGTALAQAAQSDLGLKEGTPDLKSAGPLAFGPDGVLLVGDPQGAAIFAIDTGDQSGSSGAASLNVENVNEKVAALLGAGPAEIQINDLAVNPASGNAYLSISRGRGPSATPVLLRVDGAGKISELSLKNVKFAKAALPNAPAPGATGARNANLRQESITDLAYLDGKVFVAGLSNEEFASNLRTIPFPFTQADSGTSIEIFHGAHGRFETASPVRTFVPYAINGDAHLLAAYTCTPLVKFPVSDLKPGEKVKGATVAELGNRNRPLDMIVYTKGGKDYILMANSARGVMKIPTENIDKIESITQRVPDTAGLSYETIDALQGVVQLARLNDENALVLVQSESGQQNLQTIALP